MRSGGSGEIPVETVRVARAAFPKGGLAIRVRDELGVMLGGRERQTRLVQALRDPG